MEGESCRQENKKKIGNGMLNFSNIFQPVWIRRSISTNNELDRVLLDYGFNFLLPFGLLLWIVFFIVSNI